MNQELSDKWKSSAGGVASILWLGTAVYLFLTDAESPGLLSVSAALFLVVGMFFASIVLGAAIYGLQRIVGKLLVGSLGDRAYSNAGTAIARTTSVLLLIADFVIVVLATIFSYRALIG